MRNTCPNLRSYARLPSASASFSWSAAAVTADCSRREDAASAEPPAARSPMRGCAANATATSSHPSRPATLAAVSASAAADG